MRISQAFVSGYKRVDAGLTWSRAVVLFGRNDAGKSNILEAIASATGGGVRREDPLVDLGATSDVNFVVELDDLTNDDSFDAQLLARLLQTRHVPPLFPYAYPDEAPPDRDREQELWGSELALSQFPAPLLEWGSHEPEGEAQAIQFKIGTVGRMYSTIDPVNTVAPLSRVRDELRRRALEQASDSLFLVRETDYDAEPDFMMLVNSCLGSRQLVCNAEAGLVWLMPTSDELGKDERRAATRLVDRFGDRPLPIIDRFARQIAADGSSGAACVSLSIPDTHRFMPWDVAWVSGSPERLGGLARRVSDFVRSSLELRLRRAGTAPDPWLAQDEGGGAVVSEAVHETCVALSERATAIAPPFVTRDYDIRV